MCFSMKICLVAFALILTAAPITASAEQNARDGKKGLNAVNVKVCGTDSSNTVEELHDIAEAFIQWYLTVKLDSSWIRLGVANVSDESDESEATKPRTKFKAGADLAGSVN